MLNQFDLQKIEQQLEGKTLQERVQTFTETIVDELPFHLKLIISPFLTQFQPLLENFEEHMINEAFAKIRDLLDVVQYGTLNPASDESPDTPTQAN